MGDSRGLCPHLDSIGEVTKDDLLLKSKVKCQTRGDRGPRSGPLYFWGAKVSEAAEVLAPSRPHFPRHVTGEAGVRLGLCRRSFRPVPLGATNVRPISCWRRCAEPS